jgi:hypothetical protein
MVVAKISSPPFPRDGVIDARAPEELRLDTRLLQMTKTRISQKEVPKNNSKKTKLQQLTNACRGPIIILIFLALKQLNYSTI